VLFALGKTTPCAVGPTSTSTVVPKKRAPFLSGDSTARSVGRAPALVGAAPDVFHRSLVAKRRLPPCVDMPCSVGPSRRGPTTEMRGHVAWHVMVFEPSEVPVEKEPAAVSAVRCKDKGTRDRDWPGCPGRPNPSARCGNPFGGRQQRSICSDRNLEMFFREGGSIQSRRSTRAL